MVRNLIVVVVLGVIAYLVYDNGRTISESHVRDHYRSQLEAFRASDEERICGKAAGDFSLRIVERGGGGAGNRTWDAYTACENARKTIRFARLMAEQTHGLASLDVSYDIGSIQVAPDGRSAVVESVSTTKLGEMLLARSRSTERLSRSLWQIHSHGGEAQVWSYGGE